MVVIDYATAYVAHLIRHGPRCERELPPACLSVVENASEA
jgi:hypothetical protein